jgi:hypothetical protein
VARKRAEEPSDGRESGTPISQPTAAKRSKPIPQLSPTEPAIGATKSDKQHQPAAFNDPTPTPTPKRRPTPALESTARRTSERIRTNIAYYQTPAKSPTSTKVKSSTKRSTRSSASVEEHREEEHQEESDVDIDSEEADAKVNPSHTTPAKTMRLPVPDLDSLAEPTSNTPKRVPKTPKITKATPKTPKITKTTPKTPRTSTKKTTNTITKATPKAATPGKVIRKTPKTRVSFDNELDDPLQYIMHGLAHDAGTINHSALVQKLFTTLLFRATN